MSDIGVLISGRGSNLQALIDAVADRRLDARITVVISNKPDAGGLDRARAAGIDALVMDHRAYPSRDAYDVFRELVDRFPKSRYAPDARKRMVFLFDMQARYEINVARFYFKRGAYVAAVNRSKYVLETYPRTPSIEDALGIQAMSYAHMRMPKLRDDTVRVLQRNFPESRYFEKLRAVEAKLPAPEKS